MINIINSYCSSKKPLHLNGLCFPLLSSKRTIRHGCSNEIRNKIMVSVLVGKSLREFSQGLIL
jgi:hypothetical protein